MKKAFPILFAVISLGILCLVFPPFHIRSQKTVKAEVADAKFNPTVFVEQFWSAKLLPAEDKAVDVSEVVATLAADPQKVGEKFGRKVGLGNSYFLFLRGVGHVVSASADSVGLSLQPLGTNVDVAVAIGPVFGNAVRDGTGLLDASTYPNAQEFNDISAGLNHIVETKVLPEFQTVAKLGAKVQFVGCAEVADPDSDLKPLNLVPISVKAE